MIAESIAFLVGQGKRVNYDAEHFFDGFDDDPGYALTCLRTAVGAGAHTVVCCDTNGGTLPDGIAGAMRAVVAALSPDGVRIGIHCHDDAGCGVAGSLAAVAAGATHVQGTINGYGERCGNANLISIIPNLQLKLGYACLTEPQLAALTPTATYVAELLNFTPDPDSPYVGRNAFAHKGGMHVAGVTVDPDHLRARRAADRRQSPGAAGLRAVGQGDGPGARPRRRHRARRRDRVAAGGAGQAARAPRLPLRGGRRVVRAVAAQGDGRVRAPVPARVVASDRGEARRRPRRDRGDDQDLGPPPTASATSARRRATAPSTPSIERCARRWSRFIRTCATSSWSTSRSASSTRPRGPARSPGFCSTSPTGIACGVRSVCRRT